jgi:hypothetical protein
VLKPARRSNSPTNAVYTATGAIVPSGQAVTAVTGGSFSTVTSVAVPCPFGVSLSANLMAFGCESDPLGALTYQILAEAGATAVTTAPVGGTGANAQTVALSARRALVVPAAVSHRARAAWARYRQRPAMSAQATSLAASADAKRVLINSSSIFWVANQVGCSSSPRVLSDGI